MQIPHEGFQRMTEQYHQSKPGGLHRPARVIQTEQLAAQKAQQEEQRAASHK